MKKVLKSRIFMIALTAIICITGTTYAATQILASNIAYKDTTVEDALNDLYTKATPQLLYTNSSTTSIRNTNIDIDANINSILIECYDNNKSYYVKLDKGKDNICGYHYLNNDIWFENNRYLKFNTNGKLYIGYPRTINLSSGNIVHPSDNVLYIKNIYKAN